MPEATVRLQDSTSFPITAENWAKGKGLLKPDGTPAAPSSVSAGSVTYGSKSVEQVLNELTYVPINISALTASPTTIEQGASVSVVLNWTATGNITGQSVNGQNITAAARTVTFNNVSTSTTYTLFAFDTNAPGGTQSANRPVSVSVLPRRFWGVSSNDTLTSAQILALSGSELNSGKSKSFSISAGSAPGQYIYFAYVGTLADPATYKLFGFDETFVKTVVSVTTGTGLVANYTVIRSLNRLTGTVPVDIT
jgi:hypothetical protein